MVVEGVAVVVAIVVGGREMTVVAGEMGGGHLESLLIPEKKFM